MPPIPTAVKLAQTFYFPPSPNMEKQWQLGFKELFLSFYLEI